MTIFMIVVTTVTMVGITACKEEEKVDCLVMDYAQNMTLPYLGNEQSGETYYFSPLNIFCFGVMNMADNELHAFVYHEGQGEKGGNNVATLIMKYLRLRHLIDEDNNGLPVAPRQQLSIVMDNCLGQNKVSSHVKTI